MWCVRCHTFWNWDTGRVIETRPTAPLPHNPDHRAWVASGREVDDLPCGGIPDGLTLRAALAREFARTLQAHPGATTIVQAYDAVRRAQHMRHQYPRDWDEARDNEPLRIARLLDELDEEGFGIALEKQERLRRWRRAVGLVLEGYVLATTDVLQRFVDARTRCGPIGTELEGLRVLCDTALADVRRVHARAVPRLGVDWRWVLPYARPPPPLR